jgi:hypothetical protein
LLPPVEAGVLAVKGLIVRRSRITLVQVARGGTDGRCPVLSQARGRRMWEALA